jgi:AbrB family looped-hinge helix DNA binding protein
MPKEYINPKSCSTAFNMAFPNITILNERTPAPVWQIAPITVKYKAINCFCFVKGRIMTKTFSVKVSNRYQIALPSLARKKLNIQAGDRLLVDIQDGMILLMPQPENFTEYLAGLHKDIWHDMDTTAYLEQERDAWLPASGNN